MPVRILTGTLLFDSRRDGLIPSRATKLNLEKMDKKTLKKKNKMLERIKTLEDEMKSALTKKTSDSAEISVGDYQRKINDLKTQYVKQFVNKS
jgi:hypothetical protein